MSDPFELLSLACRAAGLRCDPNWNAPVTALFAWLGRFAPRTNLVGDARPQSVVDDHLVEALVAVAAVEAERQGSPPRVIDVGAGAGLEAQMFALAWPTARVVAVEPREKRAAFIELVADAMGHGERIEVVSRTLRAASFGPEFDVATSRATFPPPQWLEEASALLVPGGQVVLHLGAAQRAGLQLEERGYGPLRLAAVPGAGGHQVGVASRAERA